MMHEYMFILTGQWKLPDGVFATFTISGEYKVQPGMTRRAAFAEIMAYARKQRGIGRDVFVSVLFFSLEPNQLGGA